MWDGLLLRLDRALLDKAGGQPFAGFRGELRARLIVDFQQPPHNLPPEVIGPRADALWIEAPKYQMVTQSDVLRYSYLMMGLWDGWATSPDRPWMSSLLLARDLSGKDKLDTIYRIMAA